ncbi:MAG: hypothetical protein KGL50_10405 [Burkholderiales bacterium]|nr:hypothetical protein [Burkholderiales bacterium]
MTGPEEIASLMRPLAPALLQGDAQALQTLELQASDLPFRGLALLAPSQAAAGGPLPVVLLVQKTSLRGWEVNEESNLSLAAFDPDTGRLEVVPALDDAKGRAYPPPDLARPPRPPASAAQTVMTRAYRFDAARLMAPPAGPGPMQLVALAYDWVSNSAPVLRSGGGPGRPSSSPAIEPAPASTPGRLPSYEATRHHPPMPDAGVAFKFEPLRDGGQALLASFAKRASASERLAVPQALATGSGPRQAVAVVPVTLALVTLDNARPTVLRWRVPVYGAAPVAEGARIAGQIAIDVGALAPPPGSPPRMAYLFIGEHVAGPEPLAAQPR